MSRFFVKIQAGERCLSVPCERAIVGAKGLFLRNVQLPEGTHVVLQICKQQDHVALLGVVCANCGDLGIAVQFKETTERTVRDLMALLAA